MDSSNACLINHIHFYGNSLRTSTCSPLVARLEVGLKAAHERINEVVVEAIARPLNRFKPPRAQSLQRPSWPSPTLEANCWKFQFCSARDNLSIRADGCLASVTQFGADQTGESKLSKFQLLVSPLLWPSLLVLDSAKLNLKHLQSQKSEPTRQITICFGLALKCTNWNNYFCPTRRLTNCFGFSSNQTRSAQSNAG